MADENKAIRKPLPEITPVNQPFWDGAKAGKLMMQKCQNCGTWVFCPRPVCGDCASDKLEWIQVSGKGKVFSFTVIREVVGQALRGFAPDIPYVTAWVDLDEGRASAATSPVAPSIRSTSTCRWKWYSKIAATALRCRSSSPLDKIGIPRCIGTVSRI